MTKKVFLVGVMLVAVLAGCGKPEDKFVGKWDGKMEYPPEYAKMMQGAMEGMAKGMADSAAKNGAKDDGKGSKALSDASKTFTADDMVKAMNDVTMVLDLKKDGTCTMGTGAHSQSMTQNGTWTLSKDGKSIAVKLQMNFGGTAASSGSGGMSQEITYKLSDDNKSMVYEQNQMGITMKMSFTKQAP